MHKLRQFKEITNGPLILIPLKLAIALLILPFVIGYILIELIIKNACVILYYLGVFISRNSRFIQAAFEAVFQMFKVLLYYLILPFDWLYRVQKKIANIFQGRWFVNMLHLTESIIDLTIKMIKKVIIKPLTRLLLICLAYFLGQSAEAFVKIWKIFWYSTDLSADLLVLIIDVVNQMDIIVGQLIKSPLFYIATAINPLLVILGKQLLISLKTLLQILSMLKFLLIITFTNQYVRKTFKFIKRLFKDLVIVLSPVVHSVVILVYQVIYGTYAIVRPIATAIYGTVKIIKNLF